MRKLAVALLRTMTHEQVAEELGVDRSTISRWKDEEQEGDISSVQIHKAYIPPPDHRVKLSPEKKEDLVRRAQAGESQKRLAPHSRNSRQYPQ